MIERFALLLAALLTAVGAAAQLPEVRSRDVRDYDFTLGLAYLDGRVTDFNGGTVLRTESDTGFSLAFDWHFRERWSAGMTTNSHRMDYTGDVAIDGPLGTPGRRVRGKLDVASMIGHAKRYFGDLGRVSPYASVGLGFVSVDTNIADGPPVGVCWWHPWWGYVCENVQPTHTTTEATMALGAGVRIELGRRLLLDAGVARQWVDFDTADRPGFSQLRLAIGMR